MWQRVEGNVSLSCLDKHSGVLLDDKIILFNGSGPDSSICQVQLTEESELTTVGDFPFPPLVLLQVAATPSDSIIGFGGRDEKGALSDQLTMFNGSKTTYKFLFPLSLIPICSSSR